MAQAKHIVVVESFLGVERIVGAMPFCELLSLDQRMCSVQLNIQKVLHHPPVSTPRPVSAVRVDGRNKTAMQDCVSCDTNGYGAGCNRSTSYERALLGDRSAVYFKLGTRQTIGTPSHL